MGGVNAFERISSNYMGRLFKIIQSRPILFTGLFFIFFLSTIIFFQANRNSGLEARPTPKPVNTPPQPAVKEEVPFGAGKFSIDLPMDWESENDRIWLSSNHAQFVEGGIFEAGFSDGRAPATEEGVREFEMQRVDARCKADFDRRCGKISDFKAIKSQEGTKGFEFFVTSPGVGHGISEGFTTEIYHSIIANNMLYRFWTSTTDSAGKNSKMISDFRSIMTTLKIKIE